MLTYAWVSTYFYHKTLFKLFFLQKATLDFPSQRQSWWEDTKMVETTKAQLDKITPDSENQQ